MEKSNREIISNFYKLLVTKDNHEIKELLEWTIWTFYKWYDDEEEEEVIISDMIYWLQWKADYMKNS